MASRSRPGPVPRALLLLALGLGGWIAPAPAARAGLVRPLLLLMRPQLEQRLTRICLESLAGGEKGDLARKLQDPCRELAGKTSTCLIDETDRSGRGLGVMSEMIQGRFGDDSEWVAKRCLARLLGLRPDSLQDVPLQELGRRMG
ncbi:MAG: hypothetical protein ACOVNL_07280, partial [Prochlorococcaceae cyanobacterium]